MINKMVRSLKNIGLVKMFKIFIAIFLFLGTVLCSPVQEDDIMLTTEPGIAAESPISHHKALKDLYSRIERTKCGRPREKVVNIYKELGVVREFGYSIYPECEVVQRCQGSGCCGSEISECVAVEKRNLNIMILTNLDNPNEPPSFQNINISTDTKCACQESMPYPKLQCAAHKKLSRGMCMCRHPCAAPFIQDPDTCECSCKQDVDKKRCDRILSGERYMGGSHCKCVQDGMCQPIRCNAGLKFNYRLCLCETKH
ncbi:vascular endothelial growth factor A-like [Antedon mediterranea]|uniref:vascular endothelial growth factor A-like n=1 Tax=Antedon mediterranea TaxID=105859 RepID=UPI003AF53FBD